VPEENELRFVRTLQPYLELSAGAKGMQVNVP
jgi:hypothetical protein